MVVVSTGLLYKEISKLFHRNVASVQNLDGELFLVSLFVLKDVFICFSIAPDDTSVELCQVELQWKIVMDGGGKLSHPLFVLEKDIFIGDIQPVFAGFLYSSTWVILKSI